VEDDLHQVGADIGDLGEDTARNTQRGRPERFTDREPDETRPGDGRRQEEHDDEHHQQFHADQHHAHAHARLHRDGMCRVGLAAQCREAGP